MADSRAVRLSARDRECWRLTHQGWTQQQIGEKFGITQPAVSQILKRVRESLPEKTKDDLRQEVDAFYADTLRKLSEIAERGPIPAYSNGRPIVDEDESGNEVKVLDYSGIIKAYEAAMKVQESRRKMLGLDDATKIESTGKIVHEIVGIDMDGV